MSTLSELIQARLKEIATQCSSLEEALRTAPEGKLRVSSSRNNARYYLVKDNETSQGRYLRRSERKLAKRLAQKEYNKSILKLLRREEKALSKAAGYYESAVKRITGRGKTSRADASIGKAGPKRESGNKVINRITRGRQRTGTANATASQRITKIDQSSTPVFYYSGPEELVWGNTIEARRNLIEPIIPDVETYAQRWLSETYEKKGFRPDDAEYYTKSGIRVRSKTELIIADMLETRGIPFHYERPLYLRGLGTVHPDFTVLNKRTRKVYYWEHLGMMDDDSYCDRALEKINFYVLNGHLLGIDLLLTHETASRPVKTQVLEKNIEAYLE